MDNEKTYIACKNMVFDVTGSFFYEKGGSYSSFAGVDCSVNLAKMDFSSDIREKQGGGHCEPAAAHLDFGDQLGTLLKPY